MKVPQLLNTVYKSILRKGVLPKKRSTKYFESRYLNTGILEYESFGTLILTGLQKKKTTLKRPVSKYFYSRHTDTRVRTRVHT